MQLLQSPTTLPTHKKEQLKSSIQPFKLDTIPIKTNTDVETEIQKNNLKGHQYDFITYNLEFNGFPILFHSMDFLHNTAELKINK